MMGPDFNLLPAIIIALPDASDAVIDRVTDAVVVAAQARAAVRTGFMRDNIHKERPDKETGLAVAGAYYSPYVNYGTYKMAAQPFMEPAAEEVRANLDALIGSIEGMLV